MEEASRVIGQCPRCGADVFLGQATWWCSNCQQDLPESLTSQIEAYAGGGEPEVRTDVSAGAILTRGRKSRGGSSTEGVLRMRYQEAYNLAHGSVETGRMIQQAGIIIGIVIAIVIVWVTFGLAGIGAVLVGVLLGAGIGFGVFAFGTMIVAQGQALLANLDTAVNTSPFLSPAARAEMMGLPSPSPREA